MTANEAIALTDALKPNDIEQQTKIKWLKQLDGTIKAEIIDTHEGGGQTMDSEYTGTTVLLVPAPYDSVYDKWLSAQIDYTNAEYTKYNNSAAAFNAAYSNYAAHYHRTHMPKGARLKFT